MTMGVIDHIAQLERDLLIERAQPGLARAKAQGEKLWIPNVLSDVKIKKAKNMLNQGNTISSIARLLNTSMQTIMCVRGGSEKAWISLSFLKILKNVQNIIATNMWLKWY
jgi:putative DNA-invertase from lambdoid prophage Rac